MNKTLLSLALAGTLTVGAGAAYAGTAASQFFPGFNRVSDNSGEYLINSNGSLSDSGDTILDVGDRLRGIVNYQTIEEIGGPGINGLGGATPNNELSGIFDVTITSKVATLTPGLYNFTFGPTASFQSEVEAYWGLAPLTLTNAAVALFDDPAKDFTRLDGGIGTRTARLAALEATAINGTPFLVWGFDPTNPAISWQAFNAADNVAGLHTLASGSALGTFNLALDIMEDGMGNKLQGRTFGNVDSFAPFPFGTPSAVNMNGNGSVEGIRSEFCGPNTDANPATCDASFARTPFDAFDNVDVVVNVPEPSTVFLLGLGALGLGFAATRRKQA